MPRISGKFQGVMQPTTPRGIRSATLMRVGLCDGITCAIGRDVSPAASNSSLAAPPTSYSALPRMQPVSRTSSVAISPARRCSSAAAARSTPARTSYGSAAQPGCAACAARTAASRSAAEATPALPIGCLRSLVEHRQRVARRRARGTRRRRRSSRPMRRAAEAPALVPLLLDPNGPGACVSHAWTTFATQ